MGKYALRVGDPTGGPFCVVTLADSQFGTNAQGKITLDQAGFDVPTAAQLKLPVHRSQSLLQQGQLMRVHFTIRPGTYNGEVFTPTGTRVQKKTFIVANESATIAALRDMYKAAFGIGRIVKVAFNEGRREPDV